MGLLRKTHRRHGVPQPRRQQPRRAGSPWRVCRLEQMESRHLLSVSIAPIQIGAVYFEDSSTSDQVGDLLEISFNGGAAGTQLAELRIDTDKLGDGLGLGDTFFDTAAGGAGVYGHSPFAVLDQSGIDSVTAQVADGGTLLILTFEGFDAGEKLVFSIDVDEQGLFSANAVAEGAEFEGSILSATFTAPHYAVAAGNDIFYDAYDGKLAGTGLDLPADDYDPPSPYMPEEASPGPVYTAGAIFSLEQEPLPITLSGTVFEDPNLDNQQQTGEPGIAGVELTLLELVGGEYVVTTATTTTDALGNYEFEGLLPGTYRVVETQPGGYLSGGAAAGTVGGVTRGVVTSEDILSGITLDGGEDSVDNDFAEALPASISGHVYHDVDNDGYMDPGEAGIGGVQVTLYVQSEGKLIATGTSTITDGKGYYEFDGLIPNEYKLVEIQPNGYLDGLDTPGTVGGVAQNPGDLIHSIPLSSGTAAVDYNFGELLSAGIGGRVFADSNGNAVLDYGEPMLSGVTIFLLDGSGNRIASTTTDANGKYGFTGLIPGVYGVEEVQPAAYLDSGEQVGTAGGAIVANDKIRGADLASGVMGLNYDFWEIVPAKISGYVFQDGDAIVIEEGDPMPNVPSLRDGVFTSDDTPLAGVVLHLCDASGVPLPDGNGDPITTVTDANGYYEFDRLYPGIYSIVEIQPEGYISGIDTAGSHGGLVVNGYTSVDPAVLGTLAVDPEGSAIVLISIESGNTAVHYNFSEVLIEYEPPDIPPIIPPERPTPITPPPTILPFVDYRPVGSPYYLMPETVMQPIFGGGGGPGGYTWHLSVIDAGHPRSESSGTEFTQVSHNPYFDPISWTGADLDRSQWVLADENGANIEKFQFGMAGATPVVGDWDGSGTSKIGAFLDGVWFLDLNGNGVWDEGDLWVKLGDKGDQPVAGDWNGDGKTDIGIFGPTWIGDLRAVAVEPGLPDSQNPPKDRPKNVPPDPADAAVGWRTMKPGNGGRMRSDLIDHVFQYGTKGDVAVTGDWNGDGIHAIGIFRNGTWFLDLDGDGRWSKNDVAAEYGQEGDLPVVGDWTGDGISKFGIYRDGAFHLDINNNRQIDATDKVFELGSAGDKPVAGDWNGDGIDEVGVYQDGAAPVPQT